MKTKEKERNLYRQYGWSFR